MEERREPEREREKEVMNGVVFLWKEDNCILLWEQRSRGASAEPRSCVSETANGNAQIWFMREFTGSESARRSGGSQWECAATSGGLANDVGA